LPNFIHEILLLGIRIISNLVPIIHTRILLLLNYVECQPDHETTSIDLV